MILSFFTLVASPFFVLSSSSTYPHFTPLLGFLQVLSAFHLVCIFFCSIPSVLFPSVLLLQELSHLGPFVLLNPSSSAFDSTNARELALCMMC